MSTSTISLKIGDLVTPRNDPSIPAGCRGRTFKIRKFGPKNVLCDAADGGRGFRCPADLLQPASSSDGESPVPTPLGVPYVRQELFTLGEIVTLNRAFKAITTSTPLVVLGQSAKTVRVTQIGGDHDRYLRIPSSGLIRRDREWLANMLLEEATS